MKYKSCAKIEDGYVTNVIVCSNVDWINSKNIGTYVPVYDNQPAGIGYQYIDGQFIAPIVDEEVEDEDN